MKGLRITVEEVEVTPALKEDYMLLNTELKEKHGIDIISDEACTVLGLFEEVFRPLCQAFSDKKVTSDEFALTYFEYCERMKVVTSVVKYAFARHNVDLTEGMYANVLLHNKELVTKELAAMCNSGKSLEDGYKYMVKTAIAMSKSDATANGPVN